MVQILKEKVSKKPQVIAIETYKCLAEKET
jgi:hypothetical protein